MSVRATGQLIADVVTVDGIADGPKMVVTSVDPERKTVQTVWFSTDNKAQTAEFPASALSRFEEPAKKAPAKKGK